MVTKTVPIEEWVSLLEAWGVDTDGLTFSKCQQGVFGVEFCSQPAVAVRYVDEDDPMQTIFSHKQVCEGHRETLRPAP